MWRAPRSSTKRRSIAALAVRSHRGCGARCLVSLSDLRRTNAAGNAAISRARSRDHDPAHFRLDRGHARCTGQSDRGQHRADRKRGTSAQRHRSGVLKDQPMQVAPYRWSYRLPFYYGWVIIGVAFVTMAIAVTARTAFSLLLPPLIDEFGWDRGLVAGAFSFGFLVSAVLSPIFGRLMDSHGPRVVIGSGVCLMSIGLLTAPSDRAAVAALCNPRCVGRRRRKSYDLHRAFAVPAELVRPPPRHWPSASPSPERASAGSFCCRGYRRSSGVTVGGRRARRWDCSCFSSQVR